MSHWKHFSQCGERKNYETKKKILFKEYHYNMPISPCLRSFNWIIKILDIYILFYTHLILLNLIREVFQEFVLNCRPLFFWGKTCHVNIALLNITMMLMAQVVTGRSGKKHYTLFSSPSPLQNKLAKLRRWQNCLRQLKGILFPTWRCQWIEMIHTLPVFIGFN